MIFNITKTEIKESLRYFLILDSIKRINKIISDPKTINKIIKELKVMENK